MKSPSMTQVALAYPTPHKPDESGRGPKKGILDHTVGRNGTTNGNYKVISADQLRDGSEEVAL
jgi:hypothetical protein